MVKAVIKSGWQQKVKVAVSRVVRGWAAGAVITRVVAVNERVILLSIYDKAEQTDIADVFLNQLLNEAGL